MLVVLIVLVGHSPGTECEPPLSFGLLLLGLFYFFELLLYLLNFLVFIELPAPGMYHASLWPSLSLSSCISLWGLKHLNNDWYKNKWKTSDPILIYFLTVGWLLIFWLSVEIKKKLPSPGICPDRVETTINLGLLTLGWYMLYWTVGIVFVFWLILLLLLLLLLKKQRRQ